MPSYADEDGVFRFTTREIDLMITFIGALDGRLSCSGRLDTLMRKCWEICELGTGTQVEVTDGPFSL